MTKLVRRRSTRGADGESGEPGMLHFPQQQADPRELAAAFERYRSAASGTLPGAPTSQELAEARMNLTRLLLQDGWEPPASVLEQLSKDEDLLHRPLSSLSSVS